MGSQCVIARGDKGQRTHLQLLLYDLDVVSLQEVQLVRSHPVQLCKQVGEEHSRHRFIVSCCVPERQTERQQLSSILCVGGHSCYGADDLIICWIR